MIIENCQELSNLTDIVDLDVDLGYKYFCETGIGGGYTIGALIEKNQGIKWWTCEVLESVCREAEKWYEGDDVVVYPEESGTAIPKMISEVGDEPVFWWLDAHLPTSMKKDENGVVIGLDDIPDSWTPLAEELEEIFAKRAHLKNDCIICDDLKIYSDTGRMDTPAIKQIRESDRGVVRLQRLQDILTKFEETGDFTVHQIENRKGYVVITPNCRSNDFFKAGVLDD